jgi:hypothetical protein
LHNNHRWKGRADTSSTDDEGQQFWVVAAEREDGERSIVRADEKLTAFVELERAIKEFEPEPETIYK